jgi:hypothetical protein
MLGKIVASVGALVLGAVAPTAVSANLIVNGSFETPVVPNGSFSNFNNGSNAITGWTVVGPQVSIVSTNFAQNGISFQANDGNQWLDLTGLSSNTVEGVQQTVALIVGHTYELIFSVGNANNPGGIFGTSSTVNVTLNGASLTSGSVTGGGSTVQLNYATFTTTFVASIASNVLAFLNGDPSNDNSNALDNVILNDLGAVGAVPLPASGLLMLASAPLLAFFRRRRKAQSRA